MKIASPRCPLSIHSSCNPSNWVLVTILLRLNVIEGGKFKGNKVLPVRQGNMAFIDAAGIQFDRLFEDLKCGDRRRWRKDVDAQAVGMENVDAVQSPDVDMAGAGLDDAVDEIGPIQQPVFGSVDPEGILLRIIAGQAVAVHDPQTAGRIDQQAAHQVVARPIPRAKVSKRYWDAAALSGKLARRLTPPFQVPIHKRPW